MKHILRYFALLAGIGAMIATSSCTLLGKHKLDDKINQLERKMPVEITSVVSATDIDYDDNRNVVEIEYTWNVEAADIVWASAEDRKQEVLSLISFKAIDRALPDLLEKAGAGLEVKVELADGTDVATITYPNISTFNAAAKGRATDVNE